MDSSLNIDSSFPEVGIAGTGEGVNCIAINKDSGSTNYGKIYIGGSFTTPGTRLARFNTNAATDTSFSGRADGGTVKAIALQTVGGVEKVLIGELSPVEVIPSQRVWHDWRPTERRIRDSHRSTLLITRSGP